MEYLTLASAANESGIIDMIVKFWYSKPEKISLVPLNEKEYSVYKSGKEMKDFRVIKKGNRLLFQGKA
jgi:hypothetical protein